MIAHEPELIAHEPEPIVHEPEPIVHEPEPIAHEHESITPEPIAAESIAPSLIGEPEVETELAALEWANTSEHLATQAIESHEVESVAVDPAPPEPEAIDLAAQLPADYLISSPWETTGLAVDPTRPTIAPSEIARPEIAEPPAEFRAAPELETSVEPLPSEPTRLEIEAALSELAASPAETPQVAGISETLEPAIGTEPESEPITETLAAEPIAENYPSLHSTELGAIADHPITEPIVGTPAIEPNQSTPLEPALDNPFVLPGEIELESRAPEMPAAAGDPPIELSDSYLFEPPPVPANHSESIVSPSSELDLWSRPIEPPIEEPPIEELSIEEMPTTIIRSPESSTPRERKVITVEQLAQPQPRSRWSASGVMLTGSVGLFALVSATYALTRPCVLGSACEPLQKAQQLDQQASQTIASTDSALKVAEAYNQIDQARRLLGTIPEWSSQYQTAQSLRSTYNDKADVVGRVLRALKQANSAALQSQNPPHPVQYWRKIQLTWREAIAMLEKVPANSPVAPLAHKKLQDYQANLAQTDARVITEQDAQDKVTNARNTAQVAETKAGLASSPESWQQVYLTWEAAIALLMQIPQGTMAQVEAKQLIPSYQAKMANASQRRLQEAASTGSLQDAINSAEQARSLEQKNQWQPAIDAWQHALDTVQGIPQGTSYYLQAQALVGEYQTALTQAKESQRRLSAMQAIKPDLSRICGGTLNVCTYTFAPEAVRVQITAQYDQVVESHINNSQLRGNFSARSEVVNQVNQLLQQLSGLSEKAKVPIELYNSNGSKFGTYTPNPSGGASSITGAQ